MDDYLLELGLSDIQIKLASQDRLLSPEERKELTDAILDVETFISRVEHKGIPFREFLSLKNQAGRLPRFQVNLTEGARFAYSEDEFVALRKAEEEGQRQRHEQTLASIPAEEITQEMRTFKPTRLHFIELFEEGFLESLEEKLRPYDFTLTQYLSANGVLVEVLEDNERKTEFHTLKELIEFLRINGRKGIEIQRYKGLGEMNADQLWETTMDPQKRTLINVTLPDAMAADHMFTMLMGEEVPPRRAFIDQHALSVKNLDI
jgi:DNA gyrase subunit B